MYSSVTLKEAILRSVGGAQVLVTMGSDIKKMSLEELERLSKEGALFLARMDEQKDKEQPKKPPIVIEKAESPPPGRKTPLDMGKVMALKKAGWSQKAIAEEMGVSQATISTALRKEEQDDTGD